MLCFEYLSNMYLAFNAHMISNAKNVSGKMVCICHRHQGYTIYSRVSMKAPLVILKLLPPIFLFNLVQSFSFFCWKIFWPFFLLRVTFWSYGEILKIFSNVDFDSSNEAFWDTEHNGKKPHPSTKHCSWKKRKNCQTKYSKCIFCLKQPISGSFSLFFQERCFLEGCGFLCCVQCPKTLNLSYHKQHSEIFF